MGDWDIKSKRAIKFKSVEREGGEGGGEAGEVRRDGGTEGRRDGGKRREGGGD